MKLLAHYDLINLVNHGVIDADYSQVNATSIDITLGYSFYTECKFNNNKIIDLINGDSPVLQPLQARIGGSGIVLDPGEFILAQSIELFNLPDDISAEYKLTSSLARSGLDHSNGTWCSAGWHGSVLTLELRNSLRHHRIRLTPGMKIGQMVFYKHNKVPVDKSYARSGKYNRDIDATPVKIDLLA